MLTFLRKHQRFFFMLVAAVTIASFLFFGTFSPMSVEETVAHKELTKAIDGSPIMEKDVHSLIKFLSCQSCDFIQKDLLSTGLGVIVAEKYFNEIKDDFKERLDKAKHYRPYTHPEAPFINAQEIWQRFSPDMATRCQLIKEAPLSPDGFALLCRLYLDQATFSPGLLKQILLYQQKQFDWLHNDPSLSEERVALFGFRSLEDWFGPCYLKKVALLVMNAAKIAEEKGYQIAKEEIKTDLNEHTLDYLKLSYPQQAATYKDAQDFLRHELYVRQIDEASALKCWKNIMLFRRLFDEVGHGIFLDNLAYHQFAEYAGESVSIERYQLPALLRFQNFRDFLKFQYYIDAVAPRTKSHLTKLPMQFYTTQEVERRCPQLVTSQFYLDILKVKLDDIAQRITLKETWQWQSSDEGFNLLVKEFPILKNATSDRLKFLDTLDEKLKLQIDAFTRAHIVQAHPEWLDEALQKTQSQKQVVNICMQGACDPFDDIDSGAQLAELLQGVAIGEKTSFYSPDKKSYYVTTVLEKPVKKKIMTFEEALKGDLIGKLLDKKLEEAYPDVRKKEPSFFQLSNGSWKAFKNVYDEVGALVYQDVLKISPSQISHFSEYAANKLAGFMEEARKSVMKEGSLSPYLTSCKDPLKDQWQLIKCDQEIKRSDKTGFAKGNMFETEDGTWSQVLLSSQGDVTFFKLLKKTKVPDPITEQITEGQRFLSLDAQRLLMNQILSRIEEADL